MGYFFLFSLIGEVMRETQRRSRMGDPLVVRHARGHLSVSIRDILRVTFSSGKVAAER